jgi:NAD(P)-dependent dehydrogenase (short-subunit alcohol dehydrogenase family)
MNARQVAVVTGASGGIGQAVSLALAAEGAHVLAVGRRRPALDALVEGIAASGGQGQAAVADLSDDTAVRELFAGPGRSVSLLVHCAGAGLQADVTDTTLAAWQQVMQSNLQTAFLCSREAALHMRARGGGRMIFVGSGAARRGRTGWSAYCAAKAGLNAFAEALADELRDKGISVHMITPGAVDTAFWQHQRRPGHLLSPSDVAAAVRYVAMLPDHVSVPELRIRPAAAPF